MDKLGETLSRMVKIINTLGDEPTGISKSSPEYKFAIDKRKGKLGELRALHASLQKQLADTQGDLRLSEWKRTLASIPLRQENYEKIKRLLLVIPLTETPEDQVDFTIPKRLPEEIRVELTADLQELTRCFNAQCYRSSVILCGRILETALHSKYYEKTGIDLLEKSPGIGLGNLIAKMSEKGIKLDPGLTQQIHLINQVRIFSVHKKQELFTPSESQTKAIILYTTDILDKLYR